MDPHICFRDKKRKIDFVLVYADALEVVEEKAPEGRAPKDKLPDVKASKDKVPAGKASKGKVPKERAPSASTSEAKRNKKELQESYLTKLRSVGVELEEEHVNTTKKRLTFVKVHIPWKVMCAMAQDLQLRAPLKVYPLPRNDGTDRFFKWLHIPNPMKSDVPNRPPNYITRPFKTSRIKKYLNSDDHDSFFATRDRQKVAYEILAYAKYGQQDRSEFGINRLVRLGIFSDAFPIHDGWYKPDEGVASEDLNARQVLYNYWARWRRWYRYQPLEHIREYFGEKIAIYFAWAGFYTAWLIPAAIFGIVTFIIGVVHEPRAELMRDICESNMTYRMCPMYDGGHVWYISTKCGLSKFTAYIENPGIVYYALFISFWAVTFLKFWKRTSAMLIHQWDCYDLLDEQSENILFTVMDRETLMIEKQERGRVMYVQRSRWICSYRVDDAELFLACSEEPPRAAYAEKCKELYVNPVTGMEEPYFNKGARHRRMAMAQSVVIMMIAIVFVFVIAVIMYRVVMNKIMHNVEYGPDAIRSLFGTFSAASINLCNIYILSIVYKHLARRLTEWEMHRTQSEFEDQLIFKEFIFQCINYYSNITYITFFKGRYIGYPGNYSYLFGARLEECKDSCVIEMAIQLIVIMILKQIVTSLKDVTFPPMIRFYKKWKTGKRRQSVARPDTRWEQDFILMEPCHEGLIHEYLDIVMQFGFITIFVVTFPLAPIFSLINNWIRIRLDAQKFICDTRRSVASRCKDIGVWFTILQIFTQLAIISNAFLIAFTTDYIPMALYRYEHNDTLVGYLNHTLSWAPPGSIREVPCRYKGYREPDGSPKPFFWKLLYARLLFVIVFEHVVLIVGKLIDLLVPDEPHRLSLAIKRERYLARQALGTADAEGRISKYINHVFCRACGQRPSDVEAEAMEDAVATYHVQLMEEKQKEDAAEQDDKVAKDISFTIIDLRRSPSDTHTGSATNVSGAAKRDS